MKRITPDNYRADRYSAGVRRALDELLGRGDVVAPVDVFIAMNLLERPSVEEWRSRRIPFLEQRIKCNFEAASRILRILRLHAADAGLRPSLTVYTSYGKGPRQRLRFSKFGDRGVEEAYSTHFVRARAKAMIDVEGES